MFYLISDSHLGHKKMEEYCGRPVGFEYKIQESLKQLTKDDVLIHLGDICIGNDVKWHTMMIQYLPCKKWLTLGNHDRKSSTWYLSHGWDFVSKMFLMEFGGKNILFSHKPIKDFGFDANIHGHFHNHLPLLLVKRWVVEGEEERNQSDLSILTKKHLCLSIEETNYQIIELNKFICGKI